MRSLFLVPVLALTALFGNKVTAQECVVAFPEQNGNWASIDGDKFVGPLVETADQIFSSAGVRVTHHPVETWTNVLEKYERGEIDILAVALRSSEREKSMNFVGPWLSYHWGPFILAGTNVEDLKNPKIGVNRALRNVQPVPTYLARLHGTAVWESQNKLIEELAAGNVDIILGDQDVVNRQAANLDLKVKMLPGANVRMTAYMAIHHNSPCVTHTQELDRAIRNWKKQDGHEQLIDAVAKFN